MSRASRTVHVVTAALVIAGATGFGCGPGETEGRDAAPEHQPPSSVSTGTAHNKAASGTSTRPELRSAAVRYDRRAGTIRFTVRMAAALPRPMKTRAMKDWVVWLKVGDAFSSGSCIEAAEIVGGLVPGRGEATLTRNDGLPFVPVTRTVSADRRDVTFAVTHRSLRGRDFICLAAMLADPGGVHRSETKGALFDGLDVSRDDARPARAPGSPRATLDRLLGWVGRDAEYATVGFRSGKLVTQRFIQAVDRTIEAGDADPYLCIQTVPYSIRYTKEEITGTRATLSASLVVDPLRYGERRLRIRRTLELRLEDGAWKLDRTECAPSARRPQCAGTGVRFEPEGEGGAHSIWVKRLACHLAHRVIQKCLHNGQPTGWKLRELTEQHPDPYERPRMVLTRGPAQIVFSLAGGGRCHPSTETE